MTEPPRNSWRFHLFLICLIGFGVLMAAIVVLSGLIYWIGSMGVR